MISNYHPPIVIKTKINNHLQYQHISLLNECIIMNISDLIMTKQSENNELYNSDCELIIKLTILPISSHRKHVLVFLSDGLFADF